MFEQLITLTDENPQMLVLRALRSPVAVCVGVSPKAPGLPDSWGVNFASTVWATSSGPAAVSSGMLLAADAGWIGDTPLLLDGAVSRYEAMQLNLAAALRPREPGVRK